MKKDTLLEIILATIGGVFFAIGMCMCLIPGWNLFTQGVITSIIGMVFLLAIFPIYRKSKTKKRQEPLKFRTLLPWIVGILGCLIFGFGMSKVMVGEQTSTSLWMGIFIGCIGLIICLLNYPIYAYFKK